MAAGMPGTTSNGHAVFVEEQRFLAAAIEDERVAPLEARDDAAFAGLLHQQVADGLLRHRAGRGRADVDPLGMRGRLCQQPLVDEVVVDDDVGHRQARQAAHGDQPGITWPGADQIDLAACHRRDHTTITYVNHGDTEEHE